VSTAVDPIALVYEEARLLDAARYRDWLAIFSHDARYWVPMSRTQSDAIAEQSIAYEDPILMRVRVERIPIAGQHVLQAPRIVASEAQRYRTETAFLYIESRGETQTLWAGTTTHDLRVDQGRLAIQQKRIDLVNAHAALPTIYLIL
jgi:3-phenylpropionate/cinnamic acid dioxygenase small subunit